MCRDKWGNECFIDGIDFSIFKVAMGVGFTRFKQIVSHENRLLTEQASCKAGSTTTRAQHKDANGFNPGRILSLQRVRWCRVQLPIQSRFNVSCCSLVIPPKRFELGLNVDRQIAKEAAKIAAKEGGPGSPLLPTTYAEHL